MAIRSSSSPQRRGDAVVALRRQLPIAMTLPRARQIIGSDLGNASKMPGRSYGISALDCNRGSELAQIEGTVCERCYARRGHYTCKRVAGAHERRIAAIDHPQWVDAMVFLINVYGERHFRWFDSGDLQSLSHLERIVEVCEHTPSTKHWLPTHEGSLVGTFLERGGRIPSNLTIRISADYIEDRPTTPTWGLPTSTVHRFKGEPVPAADGDRRKSVECRAYERANRCGQCRACWDPRVDNISYHQH